MVITSANAFEIPPIEIVKCAPHSVCSVLYWNENTQPIALLAEIFRHLFSIESNLFKIVYVSAYFAFTLHHFTCVIFTAGCLIVHNAQCVILSVAVAALAAEMMDVASARIAGQLSMHFCEMVFKPLIS